jgi:glycosyltransferase involved in cell wall biosynthesis
MPPRVTVIIATYNWSTVLPYSIRSVLDQTFADFELLVIGDGCTDDSADVVERIGDSRVRWIGIARTGHQSGPNNEGLRQAAGELIAYLGHDDLWFPHHLTSSISAIDAGADLVHSVVLALDSNGQPTLAPWPPSGAVHRKRATDTVGGWSDFRMISLLPEAELWQRIGTRFRIARVPRASVLKFPASRRPNVYRERPCHEQRLWLARIRSEPDLEARLLARVVLDHGSVENRLRRLVRPLNPRYWLWQWRRRNGGIVRQVQRYKGVDTTHGAR